MLKLCLFGQPQILWLGSSYTVPRRQTRALLFTLATHLQPIKRQRLNILFWPDAAESVARRKVSRLISDLRNALPDPNLLLATEEQVWLQTQGVQCDTADFTASVVQHTPAKLTYAVELCKSPFLQDFRLTNRPEYDVWMAEERHSFDLLKGGCLEALIEIYSESPPSDNEANQTVIKYARQLVTLEPLKESAQYTLMQRLYESGQRDAALNQYQRYKELLLRNEEGEPGPMIRRLFCEMTNSSAICGVPTDSAHPHNALFHTEHRSPPKTTKKPFHFTEDSPASGNHGFGPPEQTAKLVGRDDELAKLDRLYERASKNNGSICLISGESGSGKTALVSAMLHQRMLTNHAAQGSAFPGSHTLPYSILLEAFRSALQKEGSPKRIFSKLAPQVQSELLTLFPELYSTIQIRQSPLSASIPRTQTDQFEAIGQLLFTLAEEHPCFTLILENIQWCDETSIAWLTYIGNRIADRNILILATLNDSCNRISPPWHHSIHKYHCGIDRLQFSLSRCGLLYEIKLDELSRNDLRRFVASQPIQASWTMSNAWISQLHTMSGGNPELLLHIMEELSQMGCREEDSVDWESIANTRPIIHKIRQMFLLLSTEARQMLNILAISGPTCEIDQIQNISETSDAKIMSIVSELLVNHLITISHTQLHFRHEIMRLAVIQNIHPLQRNMLQKSLHNGQLL